MIDLPDGFVLVEVACAGDRHAAGREAARRALTAFGATLAYDGTRPVATGADASVSITHGRSRAIAVAARVARLGVDLVDDREDERLARLAARYLRPELALITTARERAACFAAKEAGLKALGHGLLDGGMFDDASVRVLSLEPPALSADLCLRFGRTPDGTIAVAWA